MKAVKKTKEYTIFKKRSGRYGVKNTDKKWINGDAKKEILSKEKLITLIAPKKAPEPEVETPAVEPTEAVKVPEAEKTSEVKEPEAKTEEAPVAAKTDDVATDDKKVEEVK